MAQFRKFPLLGVLMVTLFLLSSCSGYKEISVNSCKIKSFSPIGMRAAEFNLSASVHNPAAKVTVQYIHGVIFDGEEEFAELDVEPFVIEGRTDNAETELEGRISITKSMSMFEIMNLITNFHPDGMTVDLEMKIKTGGISKKLKFNDVSLAELFRAMGAEGLSNFLSL